MIAALTGRRMTWSHGMAKGYIEADTNQFNEQWNVRREGRGHHMPWASNNDNSNQTTTNNPYIRDMENLMTGDN